MRWLAGLVVAVLLPWATVAPAYAAEPRRVPCSRGLVALTFDDGPSATVTPKLVQLLRREGVPATFFMIGQHAEAHPEIVRMVDRAGFAIGNHSWSHEDLTTLTDAQIRASVHSTRKALVRAGIQPTTLARPPYGAMNDRVRRVLTDMGHTPVLWTIDPRDWARTSTPQIEARVLGAVKPHRTNVVLQHDGVANSPATLRAISTEVKDLRRRGFCFASLDATGAPTPPVPVVAVTSARRRVAEGDRVPLVVRLDRPTTRPTTVRLRADGRLSATVVRFRVGRTAARVWLRVPQDEVDEHGERATVQVVGARGAVAGAPLELPVVDDDPPPVVEVSGTKVVASPIVPTPVRLGIRLDRASDRNVTVRVRSPLGPARSVIAAGATTGEVTLSVPVGTPDQRVRAIPVDAVPARGAAPGAGAAVVVSPPTVDRETVGRQASASVVLPATTLGGLVF